MTARNRVFTNVQRDLLTSVLNRLIPPEGQLPGAGDLGLVTFLETVIEGESQLNRLFNAGLAQIEIAAGNRDSSGFQALTDVGKDAALKEVEASHPQFGVFYGVSKGAEKKWDISNAKELVGWEPKDRGAS